MAPSFVFPNTLQSLEEEHDDNRLNVEHPVDVTSLSPSELEEFVKGISFDISCKDIFCIEEQDLFDRVYSSIRIFSSLSPQCKLNLVESLRSNLSVLLPNIDSLSRASLDQDDALFAADRVMSCRNAFKIYTFFLLSIISSEEFNTNSNNGKGAVTNKKKKLVVHSWNWELQRSRILYLIANSLELNFLLLFGSSIPDENFVSFIVKNAFSMFENATLLKDSESKGALCRIIGSCGTRCHYTAQTCASIIHLLHKFDFAVTHMAEAVAGAEKKYADGSLASCLVREIGKTSPKAYAKDTVGTENIGRFLVELADRLPKLMAANIGVLVPHFGGESYKIRNALVGVLGKLVMKAFVDIEGEASSKSIRLRTKQAMLDILLERCRDVTAYTRSRVLHVWAELCEDHSVPIGLWNEVATIASGRLEDKSAFVRKSALNLLILMLQHNPFGPQLRVSSFEATLAEYKKKLDELEPRKTSENEQEEAEDVNSEVLVPEELQESLGDSFVSNVEEGLIGKGSSVPDVGNLEQTRALVASLEAGLRFSRCISATMPILLQLMASSSVTDVENAILLLMRCKQFQIDNAEACLHKILPLAFSQDKSIYEAVESAFITIYMQKNPTETAKNLLNLVMHLNIGDLAALEFIVSALVSKGDISSSVISALWDFFCFNTIGTTSAESCGALSLLCMAAKSSTRVLSSHLQDIIDIGFGRWARIEPLLARTACIAIQRLSEEDRKRLLTINGSLFSIIDNLVTGSWLPENIWYATVDEAIPAIYAIHPAPEKFAASLVKKSISSVFASDDGQCPQQDTTHFATKVLTSVQVIKLSRCLFVISHVAMDHLLYIESSVRKIQRQKIAKEREAADEAIAHSSGSIADTQNNNINAELGVASQDVIIDTLSERAEKEIVSGSSADKNLLGVFAPFLSKLCRNFTLVQKLPELQASAVLAVCRYMIIDADFCKANLQLLFTVAENAPSAIVRSNCIVALGDLVVRFPNLLEPWTENMYARLHDSSPSVRKNAVLVLSHLILNDMMKVKGYINEMAIRLEDEDQRISNLVKLFFHELSKKGSNPIYNLLPDLLGKLSNQNLKWESFCNIMQFLIGSIKKEKQMESLVEKLCNRFGGVTDIRQWENISYCLSQLAFTEKGLKKFIESFKTYEHALSEESVMENFKSIITKCKKFQKPELRACIEEFEEKLMKFHLEKKEQEATARNAQLHQQKVDSIVEPHLLDGSGEASEGDSNVLQDEVADPPLEGTTRPADDETVALSLSQSDAHSEVIQAETDGVEVQSPYVALKGQDQEKSKTNKGRNLSVSAPARRSLRSSKRQ